MSRARMEAFSDGVIAIVITIMVLELRAPHSATWEALRPLAPAFLSHVLSFTYLGIYWNNHHHMLHTVSRINGRILWANLHLLFWLSLIPWVTAWMGETSAAPVPTCAYGMVLLLASMAYLLLQREIIKEQGRDSPLRRAVGRDLKGKISAALYLVSIPCALEFPWSAVAIYGIVAVIWFIPDRRIERFME